MAQSVRQRNLFAAEDFTVVYDSFKQANFKAYDYDTIRGAMVDYIQDNYPENFNDWIQSSEFVALVELIAFLGHNLAFRVDLGVRENILSTAERRASVLRIADFLGYTPSRAVASSGLLKIQTVKTTQNVYDVSGNSIRNTEVSFNDDQDSNSYQNFLLVMNEIFQSTNKFGRPTSTSTISGIKTETYASNIATDQDIVFSFRGNVNGSSNSFEVHSSYIDEETNVLKEHTPDPTNAFTFVYKNDNQGLESSDTGFFVGFKQGSLEFSDYNADSAISNLTIDVASTRVNNNDVWVQSVDETGAVQDNWTKVDSTFGTSAIFNSITSTDRKLFSVKTLDNDNVAVKFGDGIYAEVPRGIVRVWYRTSLNQTYTLNPDDIGTVSFNFDYVAADGNVYTASFTATLEESVTNASSRESVASIKENAGRVFAAQDRMITAEDYSVYPLTASENIRKIKSINRTHSGHSRFIDINDPTAQYQTVNMIADDGYMYGENILFRESASLPTTLTDNQLVEKYISNAIFNPETINLFYNEYSAVNTNDDGTSYTDSTGANAYRWQQVSSSSDSSTGYLTKGAPVQRVGATVTTNELEHFEVGSIVEFIEAPYNAGAIQSITITNSGTSGYTGTNIPVTILGHGTGATATATASGGKIVSISLTNGGSGYTHPVKIEIPGGDGTATATATVATASTSWARVVDIYEDGLGVDDDAGNATGLNSNGQGAIVLNKVIPNTAHIKRIFPAYRTEMTAAEKANVANAIAAKNTFGIRFDAATLQWKVVASPDATTTAFDSTSTTSWIIRAEYNTDKWVFLTRRFRIVFGSDTDIRFYNQNNRVKFDEETNKPGRDTVRIYGINTQPDGSIYALGNDLDFYSYKYYNETDGYTNNRKLIVTISNINNDLYPDNPLAFSDLVTSNITGNTDQIGLGEVTEDGFTYNVYDSTATANLDGRADLKFQWKRVADTNQRIDPAISNVVDVFVLTNAYDTAYREWLSKDRSEDTETKTPTSEELRTQFEALDKKRSISDSIVYRSARYKPLFGETADTELRAKFRAVKVAGSTLTDSEIKSKILDAINEFFDIDNWDFGETFYFTELSTYIHNQLLGIISSVVIVPTDESSAFGSLFQVTPNTDELFIPDVTLSDIEIVDNLTKNNLRIS